MEPNVAEAERWVYRFGGYRLFPARQALLRGHSPVRIGGRALDLLRLMVERPGQLLSKAELISVAWPDTFVHEDNLKVHIAALRRALGEHPSDAPYIATVAGRGYRFVARVRVEQSDHSDKLAVTIADDAASPPRRPAIVGRGDDIRRIAQALESRRFLTIVGPAGVGKTTVALAASQTSTHLYPDGICFVDLSAIGAAQFVTAAIAFAIGAGGNLKDILAGIVETLQGQRRLLILDNCEHVLQATSLVAEQLRAALPGLAILATSREPFRSRTETVYRLPPLCCPAPGESIDCDTAMTFAAVELFAARAKELTGFVMSDATAPIIAGICRRLDGIPLAIELATPRLRGCDAATLLDLLEHSFELLSCGAAEAPLRQQTLLATLDWSYRLLSDEQAAVLRLLSVFAGGFTLEDAIGIGRLLDRTAEEMASCIEALAGKSLLSSIFSERMLAYRLLDATRSYAAERLRGAGEQPRALASHARYLLDLFERAEAEWQWRVREDWTAAYGWLANDLRKALDWAFGANGDPLLGIRLTACAIPLWDELSAIGERGRHVRRALDADGFAQCEPSVRMKLLTAHAWSLACTERLEPSCEAAWRESLRLAERTGDIDYRLRALWGLAALQCFRGQHRLALGNLRSFEALAQREGDRSAAPTGERLRLLSEFYLGDVRGAYQELTRLAGRYDGTAQRPRIARFQIDWYVGIRKSLSLVEWVSGYPNEAAATAQAALDGAVALGHSVAQADALALSAIPIALWTGRLDRAERHLAALVSHLNRLDLGIWEPVARFYGGVIRHGRGDATGVAEMRAAIDAMVAANFLVRMPMVLSMLAEALLHQGAVETARETITAALSRLESQEEFWCLAEVLRVHGLVQWREGDEQAGEATLFRAVNLAGESGALSFELRAALALAGLWAGNGHLARSIALLEPICDRFDAGAGSRDLTQARHLLDRFRALSVRGAHGRMTLA